MYGLSFRLWRVLYRTVHLVPIPGMPQGKLNTRCVQLSDSNLCMIFGSPLRPKVCSGSSLAPKCAGSTRQQAITFICLSSAHRALNVL